MGQEKQRISERLARVDTEREKLSDQLKELEFAERVLARFGEKAVTTKKRRRESTPSHWSADTAPCRSSHRLSAPPARGSAGLGIYAAFIGIIGTKTRRPGPVQRWHPLPKNHRIQRAA